MIPFFKGLYEKFTKKKGSHSLKEFEYDKEYEKFRKDIRGNYFRMVLFGSSNTGKSYFLKNYLLKLILDQYDCVVLFITDSIVYEYIDTFRKLGFPDNCIRICTRNHLQCLQYMIAKQAMNRDIEKSKKMKKNIFRSNLLFIWDDVLDPKITGEKIFVDQFTNYRHYQISIIFVAQITTKIITPQIRNNISFFGFFKLPDQYQKRILIDNIGACLNNANDAEKPFYNNEYCHDAESLYKDIIGSKDYGHIIINGKNVIVHMTNGDHYNKCEKNDTHIDDESEEPASVEETDYNIYTSVPEK